MQDLRLRRGHSSRSGGRPSEPRHAPETCSAPRQVLALAPSISGMEHLTKTDVNSPRASQAPKLCTTLEGKGQRACEGISHASEGIRRHLRACLRVRLQKLPWRSDSPHTLHLTPRARLRATSCLPRGPRRQSSSASLRHHRTWLPIGPRGFPFGCQLSSEGSPPQTKGSWTSLPKRGNAWHQKGLG